MLTTLDNGMRVILQENRSAPVVALQVWVNVGSADDPKEAAGLAHVLEHMVFKGTSSRDVGDVAKEIEAAGGDINAWTSFDQTVFHVVMASRYFATGLDVLADTMQRTQVDSAELKRELEVVLEEIKEGTDSPGKVASRALFRTAFRKHAYGRPVIGYKRTVAALDAKTVGRLFRQRYVPNNMTLVVVGDIDRRRALGRIEKVFSSKRPAFVAPGRMAEPVQRRLRVSVKQSPSHEAHLSMAFHIPRFVDPATPPLDLAAIILGQGDSSRLVRRVRRELGLVTDIYAYAYTPRDAGLLIIGATTQPKNVAAAVRAITREVLMLGEVEVSAGELERAQTIIESDAIYQKETVQGQARKLGFYQTVAGDLGYERRYHDQIAAVTPARLKAAAKRHLLADNLTVAVVTPRSPVALKRSIARAVAGAAKIAATPAPKVVPSVGEATRIILKNGARLVYMRDASVPLLAMRAVWLGGTRYETSANNGVSRVLSDLMTRGTANRTADQISDQIEGMAGMIGGFAGRNSFGVRAEFLSRHWEQGFDIVADCLLNATFPPQEVERVKRESIEAIRAQDDNSTSVAMRIFARTMYKTHPYRLSVIGDQSAVQRLTRKRLLAYYRKHFTPGKLVIGVVGDVDPRRVAEKFRQLFGSATPKGAAAPKLLPEPRRDHPTIVFRQADKAQAHIVMGYPGTTLKSKDRFAVEVLMQVLSGQGGRLFLELRDRQSLAYRLTAFAVEGLEPGYIAAYIATSEQKIEQAIAGFDREFDKVRRRRVGQRELQRAKRYLMGTHDVSLQRKSAVATFMAFNEIFGLGFREHTGYDKAVSAVTAADVQRVAKRYLDDRKRVIAVVHPQAFSPAAQKRLGEALGPGVAVIEPK